MRGEEGGACGGEKSGEVNDATKRRSNRFKSTWHDDAVDIYSDYAFVIAFENVQEDGYFTEKIVNPMLAGSVPIYWGWDGVRGIFDDRSIVMCESGDLEGCADRVIDLWMSGDWIAMAEQPRASEESLRDWFGWPEAAGSVVEEIARANWLSSDGGLL